MLVVGHPLSEGGVLQHAYHWVQTLGDLAGHRLPVAMCSSEKWTPSMLIVPRKGFSSWSPATTTEFHKGSILHSEERILHA